MKRRRVELLPWIACLLFGAATWFWVERAMPDIDRSGLPQLVKAVAEVGRAPETTLGPAEFCERWTGLPLDQVDCRSGRALSNLSWQSSGEGQALLQTVRQEAGRTQAWLEGLRESVARSAAPGKSPAAALASLEARHAVAQGLAQGGPEPETPDEVTYRRTFERLLALCGMSYRAAAGEFRLVRWDIYRLADHAEIWQQRSSRLALWIPALPTALSLMAVVLAGAGYLRAGWPGLGMLAAYASLTALGVLIAADASTGFGAGSTHFHLSPLGGQFERQVLSLGCCHAVLLVLLLAGHRLAAVWVTLSRHLSGVALVVAASIASAYQGLSPAAGAECLKIGVALMATLLMVDQGRALHLARRYAPGTVRWTQLRPSMIQAALQARSSAGIVMRHIGAPLIILLLFALFTFTVSAVAFHDLGGSLVGILTLVVALFLVFGAWPAALSLGVLALAGSAIATSDKFQARLELMLQPMTASVSDFARLLAFADANSAAGFRLGELPWCNAEGTCLPIQVLSDYMPAVLSAAGGRTAGQLVLAGLSILMLGGAGLGLWRFLTGPANSKWPAMLACFLFTANFLQTMLTFLGNWRLVPLTGLGVPMVSIGWSSLLSSSLAIGALLASMATRPEQGDVSGARVASP